jgi:hypothetical protein
MSDEWYLTDWTLMDFGEKKVQSDKKPELTVIDKGDCPKCGKHIGRGIHNHAKACDGHPGDTR